MEQTLSRFDEHLIFYNFKSDLLSSAENISPDIPNLANLVLFGSDMDSTSNISSSMGDQSDEIRTGDILSENTNIDREEDPDKDNSASLVNGRYQGKFVSHSVVNLSSKNLTKHEISLLSKGLKFVPTPINVNRAVLKEELEIFGRRLRLLWHFRNEESNSNYNRFRPKSKFNPKGKDAAIEIYLSRLEEEILSIDTQLNYSNLTKEERQALKNLQNDHSIVIKEADKGSAVVVWDREDYLREAEGQLSDQNVYEELSGDVVSPLINIVKYHLTNVKLRGDVSEEIMDYFLVKNPKVGRFYLLPKIHKRLNAVPGRPVISNCGYYTENISSFVEHHLQPLSRKVKSYIKDTNDFLKKLRELPRLPDEFLLCTVDVVGLYPNIPHEDGLAAIREALNQRDDQSISTDSLMELASCVLKNNIFEHNSRYFKQKQGTAIGTKLAPPYAILFMAALEEKILEASPLKPFVWWRYIDDIFMIWQHGEEKLKEFLELINSCHPSIKFTADYSSEKVNFLDAQVIRKGNQLITDLYVKPTDTHQYLDASSCHVYHSKRSIPYSQALRLNRICSDGSFLDKRCNDLESWLKVRGYKDKMVRGQILKARHFNRNELLDRPPKDNGDRKLVLNITYHPAFARIKDTLSKINLLLTPDEEHRRVFPSLPLVGFKRGKSLKDILVRAKLPKVAVDGSSGKCGGGRCGVCKYVEECKQFTDKTELQTYQIKGGDLNCNSENVVYLVQCKTCKLQYVGSASTKFRLRFNNYKCCHRKYCSNKPIAQASFHAHFNQLDHHGMEDWSFTLIDKASDVDSVRKKESFWQYKLNSFTPHGLNEREVSLDYG